MDILSKARMFPETLILSARFSDIDIFLEHIQQQMQVDCTQLETGPVNITSQLIMLGDICISRFSTSKAQFERLCLPAGYSLIGFTSQWFTQHCNWCGIPVPPNSFGILRPGKEYALSSPSHFDVLDIMIPDNWLVEQGIVDKRDWHTTREPEKALFSLRDPQGLLFRDMLFNFFDCDPALNLLRDNREISSLFREWVLEKLASVIAAVMPVREGDKTVKSLPRFEIVQSAVKLVDNHIMDPFSTEDLASKMGVSPRVLQYAFQETCSISPLRFILHRKLHAARTNLFKSVPDNSSQVARVAMLYNMNHLGRFSQNYKELFGESPSTTLAGAYTSDARSLKE